MGGLGKNLNHATGHLGVLACPTSLSWAE